MATPQDPDARMFYRSALQRIEDAEFLAGGGRTTGAIYLAGYGVECILKALILTSIATHQRSTMIASFRGSKAHDYDWLLGRYRSSGGSRFPPPVAQCFALVNTWGTDLRYRPGMTDPRDTHAFLDAAHKIIDWAQGRF